MNIWKQLGTMGRSETMNSPKKYGIVVGDIVIYELVQEFVHQQYLANISLIVFIQVVKHMLNINRVVVKTIETHRPCFTNNIHQYKIKDIHF